MNRINIICLGVRDMAASLAFYKNIGFQTYVKEDKPPIVFFNNKGTKLELYPLEELAKDISADNPPELSAGGFGGITMAVNLKSEAEVDSFIEMVEASGGTVVKKPQQVFWGGYSGYFRDPNGYYWEAAYAALWKFDENDMIIIEEQ